MGNYTMPLAKSLGLPQKMILDGLSQPRALPSNLLPQWTELLGGIETGLVKRQNKPDRWLFVWFKQ